MKYRVIFKGEMTQDQSIDEVKNRLADLIKKDAATIDKFFSGQTVVLKKDASIEECEKIKRAFTRAGAICHIEPIKEPLPDTLDNLTLEKDEKDHSDNENIKPPPLPKQMKRNQSKQSRRADEKYCESCGNIIKVNMLACPHCGKKVKKTGSLPGCAIAAIALGVFFVVIAIIGILAAIAIPQFMVYRNRAHEEMIKVELREVARLEDEYYSAYKRYTANLTDLDFVIQDPKIIIEIPNADENCFEVKGTTYQLRNDFWIDCNGNERQTEKVSISPE